MEKSYVLQLPDKKFEDLSLCFCGYAECEPLHSFGPAARPNYVFHYIMSGKGIYKVGEQTFHLEKGQGFMIEPEQTAFIDQFIGMYMVEELLDWVIAQSQ